MGSHWSGAATLLKEAIKSMIEKLVKYQLKVVGSILGNGNFWPLESNRVSRIKIFPTYQFIIIVWICGCLVFWVVK